KPVTDRLSAWIATRSRDRLTRSWTGAAPRRRRRWGTWALKFSGGRMSLLKLPKYVEMPGHVSPVTGCKPGDIAPLVILTNFREHVERCGALLDTVSYRSEAGG